MKVLLTDHTVNPVSRIGKEAAICYDAKTDDDSNKRRAGHCKEKGHLATLRFAYASFNIQGISRVASHQLVRVAHAGILQESQRYVKQTNIQFITPPSLADMPDHLRVKWGIILRDSQELYASCLDAGMKKEDARYILPQACTTQLNMTGNFQMWRDLLGNRTKKAAQWEVRQVAVEIQNLLNGIAPEIFDKI